ncbi:ATP synthase F1 subunit delta [Flavobacterium columnare NBRC 100251 = ATCC 23463]|uniref:ATP synthase subunit delta n=1 Tax=Flavobacterium columnare TaxID=996 RepID=A0AAI8CI78_9FLAO|nr:ATP synthase F1 subunit delta [Flavobacterium columnare]AMO20368.1 ATP synthase F1 subunit delta [Flavobacterium columnare]ANO49627.1 ATP synthase subunit delta [Flavobacterium columnare]APT22436.1 ATP synthase F1 subunit delta [Flavobacterium columnare]AUX18328.1 ATP synthase subunit delta [Flavobacterium columnare]MBF6656035.1 ATP synthase F1 subunit delta [Flavobacterium columnare]
MSGNRAAVRYAKAILDVATSKSSALEVNNDMTLIAKTIQNNAELALFITNPTLKLQIKYNALLEVFKEATAVTKSLFQLLLANKRFELLEKVATQYTKLYDEANGVQLATVTTAFAMTPELEAKVLVKAGTLTTKKVTLKNIVDPTIIGGFVLKIGDKQYNASVANSLLTLKRELSN